MQGLLAYSIRINFVILSLVSTVFSMKFNYNVEPNQIQCIGEYLTENTVGKYHSHYIISNLHCQIIRTIHSLSGIQSKWNSIISKG